MKKQVKPGETPAKITVSMIDQDLKDGISKTEMTVKYGIKPWEVDEMFKHPFLKGRRPSRKKALSFVFEDDITDAVDPNQVTLEDAIDDAIDSATQAQEALAEAEKAVVEMLSPTEYETPEETLLKSAQNTDDEEELEMDDDTFEL